MLHWTKNYIFNDSLILYFYNIYQNAYKLLSDLSKFFYITSQFETINNYLEYTIDKMKLFLK